MVKPMSTCDSNGYRHFSHSLTVLLWKNFKIASRSKVLLTIEILVPLFFFLVLFWIRKETVPVDRPTCSYLPKGMPSAGLFPMIQTYFCGLTNPCILAAPDDESTGAGRQNLASFENLLAAVRRDLQNEEFSGSIAIVLNSTAVLIETLLGMKKRKRDFEPVKVKKYWKATDLYNETEISTNLMRDLENCLLTRRFFVDAIVRSLKNENFRDDFCKRSLFFEYVKFADGSEPKAAEFQKIMCTYFPLEKVLSYEKYPFQALALFENITGYSVNFNRALAVVRIAKAFRKALNVLANSHIWHSTVNYIAAQSLLAASNSSTTKSFDSLSFLLCGQRLLGLDDVLKKRSQMERLRELFIRSGGRIEKKRKSLLVQEGDRIVVNKTGINMNNDDSFICRAFSHETADEECWEWLQSFRLPNKLTTQLFTLFRGFILISPSNPVLKKIVNRWNERLHHVEAVRSLLIYWYENVKNYSIDFERSKLNEGLKVLARIYLSADSALNITSFLSFGHFYHHVFANIASASWKTFSDDHVAKSLLHGYNLLRCFRSARIHYVKTEREMEEAASCLSEFRLFFSGIVFSQLNRTSVTLPSSVEYKIRMADYLVDDTSQITDRFWNPRPRDQPFVDLKYVYFGFSILQDLLDEEILHLLANNNASAGIYVQQFPSSCHSLDLFWKLIERTLPMFMILSWIFSVAMILKCLVLEKELKLKEFMKTMGVGHFANSLAWFVHFFTLLMTSAVIIILVLKYGRILPHVDFIFLVCFFTLYACAIISLCFFISRFFNKASQAAIGGTICYFVLFLPYPAMLPYFSDLTNSQLYLSCILPQVAFGWGCTIISWFEKSGRSLHWYEMFANGLAGDHFGIADVSLMLLLDAAIYAMLPWCFKSIWTQSIRKGRNYVLCFPYCFKRTDKRELINGTHPQECSEAVNYEQLDLAVGISVINLTKIFDDGGNGKKHAVDHLNVEFYDGQIACLLGPNGAGKTTMMSILCGLLPPSDGSVLMDDQQVVTCSSTVNRSIGYCPQYNVLFNELTVKEHLYFYASLRGVDSSIMDDHVEKILHETCLRNKANVLASTLSGGMKRRLSIAIAFIGMTKVILLDEPTANVDPQSRRRIWDLLLKCKMSRTILFSTHYFDEAEILSDRIAVIVDGRLKCCGSSLFLKAVYRAGYNLVLQMATARGSSPEHVTASTEKITSFVTAYMPEAIIVRVSSSEIQFKLPGKVLEEMQPLVVAIGSHMKELNCLGYGLSECNLETIFYQETEMGSSPAFRESQDRRQQRRAGGMSVGSESCVRFKRLPLLQRPFDEQKRISPRGRVWTQICCFVEQRKLSCIRDWRILVFYIILPVLLVILALALRYLKFSTYEKEYKQLSLGPSLYGNTTESFFSLPRSSLNWSSESGLKSYVENMILYGLGKNCYQDDIDRSSALLCHNITEWSYEKPSMALPTRALTCQCDSGNFFPCDKNDYPHMPERYNCSNGIVMSDLTYVNITSWLLMTERLFSGKRYGGFSVATPSEPFVELNSSSLNVSLKLLYGAFSSFLENMAVDMKLFHPYEVPSFNLATMQNMIADMNPKENYKIWFNNQGWAALPSYTMAFSNARLRALLPADSNQRSFGISVINHPMPQTSEKIREKDTVAFEIALCLAVLFSLCSCTAGVCMSVVEEKSSGVQQLLFISGLRRWLYWIFSLFFDLLLYVVAVASIIVALIVFEEQQYVGSWSSTLAIMILFFMFGLSSIPSVYVFSKLFESTAVAFMVCALGGFFIGSTSYSLATAFELLSEDNQELRINIYSSREFPTEAVDNCLLDWDVLGKPIVIMLIEGAISVLLLLIIEYRGDWDGIRPFFNKLTRPEDFSHEENVDAPTEKANVLPKSEKEEQEAIALKVVNLTKDYFSWFNKATAAAVDNVCFELRRGECLGLLGQNGAGKTTIFKMITGELKKSAGNVFLHLKK
uniref:ABC transporter domain-containing protein n=1 Tax=Trichuris muris TaxID=70415 RepID=A0A5S6Q022_TRIMR